MPHPLRIAVVGPTFPYTGGISSHTTTLANRLRAAGHDVRMISWKAQYPRFLRGGTTHVPGGLPEVRPVADARFPLAWYDPFSWIRVGRRLRGADVVIVTAVTPYHAVPYLVLRAALGRKPRAVVIAHNVLPHEGGRIDRPLVRALYRGYGHVLTHSDEQAGLARRLAEGTGTRVASTHMPLPDLLFGDRLAADIAAAPRASTVEGNDEDDGGRPVRLTFFGMIREYKGVDLLIEAVAAAPRARLLIAGEFWQPVDEYRAQIERLGVGDRIEIREGYVSLADLPAIFESTDALVLPYRRGTASYNVALAHLFGVPVVTTDAGTLARDVSDGVDGVVVPAGDAEALGAAFRRLSEPGTLARLRQGVRSSLGLDEQWAAYVDDLLALAEEDAAR